MLLVKTVSVLYSEKTGKICTSYSAYSTYSANKVLEQKDPFTVGWVWCCLSSLPWR